VDDAAAADGQAAARQLPGAPDDDAQDLAWAAGGRGPLLHRPQRGTSNVWFAPAGRGGALGSPRQVTRGTHMLSMESLGGRSAWACARRSRSRRRRAHRPRLGRDHAA
jgi:hypothetical protein